MSQSFTIKPASVEEFQTAIDWAASEGWNPGLEDLATFHNADPEGFLMGWVDGNPVSSISVVRYGTNFGFLGFYIVHPDHRGGGLGMATWEAGMTHLKGRSIALDGVVDQQDNYRKSGFNYVARNIRFTGTPIVKIDSANDIQIRPVKHDDLAALYKLDEKCFPTPRTDFIHDWCMMDNAKTRKTFVAVVKDQVCGFGTIRECEKGYKIGPLFCETFEAANALFNVLASLSKGKEISLDVSELNSSAIELASKAGLSPVFETARMVRGEPVSIDWSHVYGIASFELG